MGCEIADRKRRRVTSVYTSRAETRRDRAAQRATTPWQHAAANENFAFWFHNHKTTTHSTFSLRSAHCGQAGRPHSCPHGVAYKMRVGCHPRHTVCVSRDPLCARWATGIMLRGPECWQGPSSPKCLPKLPPQYAYLRGLCQTPHQQLCVLCASLPKVGGVASPRPYASVPRIDSISPVQHILTVRPLSGTPHLLSRLGMFRQDLLHLGV